MISHVACKLVSGEIDEVSSDLGNDGAAIGFRAPLQADA